MKDFYSMLMLLGVSYLKLIFIFFISNLLCLYIMNVSLCRINKRLLLHFCY